MSFAGELKYETNVQASLSPTIWEALMSIGESEGVQALGTDALMLLRLEKGFLHIGTDTDGTTVPEDIGWGEEDSDLIVGSRLRLPSSSDATDGSITSAGRAVMSGEPIALAVLRGGRQHLAASPTVHDVGTVTHATVVETPFFDPSGAHMNGQVRTDDPCQDDTDYGARGLPYEILDARGRWMHERVQVPGQRSAIPSGHNRVRFSAGPMHWSGRMATRM